MTCSETITRTYQATDLCGNFIDCTQTITVNDTGDPILESCPEDMTVEAQLPNCDAVVTYAAPEAADNCAPIPSVVCDPPSGSTFLVGTTAVTCTATDQCDNTAMCSFDVTVSVPQDLDNDGQVGPGDLAMLLGSWGLCPDCPADLNGDGVVDPVDLATLLGGWGLCG